MAGRRDSIQVHGCQVKAVMTRLSHAIDLTSILKVFIRLRSAKTNKTKKHNYRQVVTEVQGGQQL